MKIIADLHTHTIASGHAYSTLKENIEQALLTDLEYLGVSDHTPGMPNTTCEGYFHNLKVLRKNINGMRILKGAEANILDAQGRIDLPTETLSRLDYVIASLHDLVVENMGVAANTQAVVQAMKNPYVKIIGHPDDSYFPLDYKIIAMAARSVAANTQAIVQAMKNPYVKIIGHPDDSYFPLDYKIIAMAARSAGVALELNNSSLSPNSSRTGGPENARKLLEQCELAGASVMVGSDSHIWYDIGEFGYALSLLKQVNFPTELVINSDLARFEAFMKLSCEHKKIIAVA